MPGETNLAQLLRDLKPVVLPGHYVFCSLPGADYGALAHTRPFASVAEPEGLTLVLLKEEAEREGLAYHGTFRCISLQVHSSLEAVGLTAAVARELAIHDISANLIAGYYHDHVFVPAIQADLALNILQTMSPRLTDE